MLNTLDNDGVRTLHFGSAAVQGAMRIDQPDDIELEYVQQMMMWLLFRGEAAHIAQLGLGAAALTKFCYRRLAPAKVTAVELDAEVVDVCRSHFALPPDDERLSVLNMNALDYVMDFSRRRSIDVLQVDLYDAQAKGPLLSTDAFYAACANCLTAKGMMTVNLYCDWPDHLHHIQMMANAFDAVAWLPEVHDGNMVAIAFKQSPSVDFDDLYARAAEIRATLGLPAETWVEGLHSWMSHDTESF
ncbi:spermine/spermidine synthase domain-containing protein [Eoetvoesiella caeni]|uniref:Spermidine synthase n=1 Tax=Eoetvoesiella caeni TaxID=645616 RepID=A0A366H1W4_9BURK|nr:spermidine synthase [Eoetvoesiella caeni]MCI2810858.1 spermidine synthase [Eoetvoesiella caeni]NYT56756.1 spermidine synthase [Eoetvoesiella caeni]RBP35736.1 spermidine synthase [Eoetvoesiella caeni]